MNSTSPSIMRTPQLRNMRSLLLVIAMGCCGVAHAQHVVDVDSLQGVLKTSADPLARLEAMVWLSRAPDNRVSSRYGHGYELMGLGENVKARDLFYVNVALYPASSNVYDSYAEACLKNGEEALALINYKKALAMDPKNTNAERVIEELEGKK